MATLVLVRHGESQWNLENRFTGWVDVPLSPKGEEEALKAGEQLKHYRFDVAYTSDLERAQKTLSAILKVIGQEKLPIHKDQALNERHYGALQGLNKSEMAVKFGEEQVMLWRRSYDVRPPALEPGDSRHPGRDPRYAGLSPAELPRTECLKDTVERFVPYWEGTIAPQVAAGRRVILAAHGNSMRALVKHLDGIGDQDIVGLNIPTGIPLVYELDASLKPLRRYYLGEAESVAAAVQAVANQGKARA